jgi:hypothetical protein
MCTLALPQSHFRTFNNLVHFHMHAHPHACTPTCMPSHTHAFPHACIPIRMHFQTIYFCVIRFHTHMFSHACNFKCIFLCVIARMNFKVAFCTHAFAGTDVLLFIQHEPLKRHKLLQTNIVVVLMIVVMMQTFLDTVP